MTLEQIQKKINQAKAEIQTLEKFNDELVGGHKEDVSNTGQDQPPPAYVPGPNLDMHEREASNPLPETSAEYGYTPPEVSNKEEDVLISPEEEAEGDQQKGQDQESGDGDEEDVKFDW